MTADTKEVMECSRTVRAVFPGTIPKINETALLQLVRRVVGKELVKRNKAPRCTAPRRAPHGAPAAAGGSSLQSVSAIRFAS